MRVLTVVVLVGLSLAAFGSDMPRPAPIPRPQPEPVGPDWVPCAYCGRVVGITEKGLTIKPERGLKIFIIKPLPDGTTREWVYVQDNTQPPREFVFNDCLFFDRPGPKTPRCGEHQVSDLRVGDFVEISCHRFRGLDFCTRLEIQRRPGGKVPPALHDDKTSLEGRVDTRRNAEQFIEEKVVPKLIPRLFVRFHP